MAFRVLTGEEVREHLPMPDCIEAMGDVLARLARGELHQPLRGVVRPPGATGLMGLMPAHRDGESPRYALKAVCIFPGNPALGLDAHQGAVLLYSGTTGQLEALLDGAVLTEIRTAAVTAVATRALAREDARTLTVLGAGVQARAHLDAVPRVRDFERVLVWSRRREAAEALAREARERHGLPVEVAASAEAAVRAADVLVTATSAREPVVEGGWLQPGVHVNAVGSSIPTTRELDGAAVAAATLFVDRRESTVNESGDYLMALREGAIGEGHIAGELGEVLVGSHPGRRSDDEITLFKSLGLAVEDLAAAELALTRAEARGAGTLVPL